MHHLLWIPETGLPWMPPGTGSSFSQGWAILLSHKSVLGDLLSQKGNVTWLGRGVGATV